MSEHEEIMCASILEGIRKAQRQMLERKAKLGESVVYADEYGVPYEITAEEALVRMKNSGKES